MLFSGQLSPRNAQLEEVGGLGLSLAALGPGRKNGITKQNPLSNEICLAERAKQLDWPSECSALTEPQLIMS